MLAAFPLAYVGYYTAQLAWFRANNFTHILPPFVLGFAWAMVALLDAVLRRRRVPRPILAAGVLGLGALLVSPGILFVYRTYTWSTLDSASRFLEREEPRLRGRVVIVEPVEAHGVPWGHSRSLTEKGVALVRVPSAAELPEARRRQSDAEILRGKMPAGIVSGADHRAATARRVQAGGSRLRLVATRAVGPRPPKRVSSAGRSTSEDPVLAAQAVEGLALLGQPLLDLES